MKKKLNAILAMLLCVACLPVMPLNANAEEETLGDYNDPLTVETDLFTYNHGAFRTVSEDVLPYDNFTIVTGVCYGENQTEPVSYIVERLARTYLDRGTKTQVKYPDGGVYNHEKTILDAEMLNAFMEGQTLAVGDILLLDGWFVQETFPGRMYPATDAFEGYPLPVTAEYVGNGAEIIGEDFMKAVRHEVGASIAQMKNCNIEVDDSAIVSGDATEDETVDIVDVLATNKYLLGVQNFGDYSKLAADVNKDGAVDDSDSMTILKSVVGLAELN